MKKLFVILFTICTLLLSGCKPALPSTTIYISNETGSNPDSYELELLFNDSKNPNVRAFHMKNIGSEIVSNSKAIVLENMPRTIFVAHVNAYDSNGNKVGTGERPFQAGIDDSVYVSVEHWEKPYALVSKSFRFQLGAVDSIKLNVKDTKGKLVFEETYPNLAETTFAPITTGKIRIESDASTFEWILKKGDNAVAVYIDTLDSKLTADETRKLDEVSFEMGFQEITDWTANTTNFEWLTLKVIPDEKLRSTISGFNFTINGKETVNRGLASDNLYLLPKEKNLTIPHDITVTPVLLDGSTEIKSLSQTVKAQPNIKLESIEFEGIDTSKVQNLELGLADLEFDIRKKPVDYTKFGEGELKIASGNSIDFKMSENGHVTVTPVKLGKSILTYTEPVYNLKKEVTVNVKLHEPILKLDAIGSDILLTWDYIHPDTVAYIKGTRIHTDEKGNIQAPEEILIPLSSNQKEYKMIGIGKRTSINLYIEVSHAGTEPVRSNSVSYKTGDNSFVNIIIPDLERFNVEFEHDLTLSEPLKMGTKVELRAVRNDDVKSIAWKINGKTVSREDTFVYSPDDPGYGLKPNSEIAKVEILLVVETTSKELYSKNIRLIYTMESEI